MTLSQNSSHFDTIVLTINGMASASTASRIERRLNKIDTVFASVNYATEKGTVSYDTGQVSAEQIIAEIARVGFTAQLTVTEHQVALPKLDHTALLSSTTIDPELERTENLQSRLIVGVFIAIPIAIISLLPLPVYGWQWAIFILVNPVVFWVAFPLHHAAVIDIAKLTFSTNVLISATILATYVYSTWYLINEQTNHLYFLTVTIIVVVALLIRLLIAKAYHHSGELIRPLLSYRVQEARLVSEGGIEQRILAQRLMVGQCFVVRSGEKIAADGYVIDGVSTVDTSLLTGQSRPIPVRSGAPVTAGTVNLDERIVVRAARVGSDTLLAQLGELIQRTQIDPLDVSTPARQYRETLRILVVILLAAVAFLVQIYSGNQLASAAEIALAVILVASPSVTDFANAIALRACAGSGISRGVLINGDYVLKRVPNLDSVVLNKTGILTTADLQVVAVFGETNVSASEIMRVADALETQNEHPISSAIAAYVRDSRGQIVRSSDINGLTSRPGRGITGIVDGRFSLIGCPNFMIEHSLELSPLLQQYVTQANDAGYIPLAVAWSNQIRGIIVITDQLKSTSVTAVSRFQLLKLQPWLITADSSGLTHSVSQKLGISPQKTVAGVLPSDKPMLIRRLQGLGHSVAAVGDGVVDAAVLRQADIGVAINNGHHLVTQASDITVMRSDLGVVVDAFLLIRHAAAVMRTNTFWIFAYHAVTMPLAIAGYLSPITAMVLAGVCVLLAVNHSLRIKSFQPSKLVR